MLSLLFLIEIVINYLTTASRKLTSGLFSNQHSQAHIFKQPFKITFAVVSDGAVTHGGKGDILITIHIIVINIYYCNQYICNID